MFSIFLASESKKFLERCDKILSKRIVSKIEKLKENPIPSDAKIIKGSRSKLFRIRVGDYRILYEIYYEEKLISINKIDKRSRIYKR